MQRSAGSRVPKHQMLDKSLDTQHNCIVIKYAWVCFLLLQLQSGFTYRQVHINIMRRCLSRFRNSNSNPATDGRKAQITNLHRVYMRRWRVPSRGARTVRPMSLRARDLWGRAVEHLGITDSADIKGKRFTTLFLIVG